MSRASWLLALGLLVTGAARAQEAERIVRLELTGGEVLEGRLAGFERRVYRVRLADGAVREVREEDVKRLELLGQSAAGRPSACQALADVLRRAEASGALRQRVLGTHWFLFTDQAQGGPHEAHEAPRPPEQYLLEVTLRREATPQGERLLLQVECLPRPGNSGSRPFLRLRGPARLSCWLDPADGRLARLELLQPSRQEEGVAVREGDQLRIAVVERGRSRPRDLPWDDDLLPDAAVYFLLAPLLDQGFPPGAHFRLLEGVKLRSSAETTHRLRALPGSRPTPAGKAIVVEHVTEHAGQPQTGSLRLFLGQEGPWQGQVVRLETELWSRYDEVSYPSLTIAGERVDRARFEALVKEWGAERPPQRAPAPVPPPPGPMVQPPPGPVADLLRGARQAGALGPVLGERWFVSRGEADQVRVTRFHARLEGERLVVEVRAETVGDPEGVEEHRLDWDPEGRLVALAGRDLSDGGVRTWEARCAGEELEVASVTSFATAAGREEQRSPPARFRARGEPVPELFLCFGLSCLPGLPGRLELAGLVEASLAETKVIGPITRDLVLREVPLPPDGKALALSPSAGRLDERLVPVPADLSPRAARVIEWVSGEAQPMSIVWLGERGEPLGMSPLGRMSQGADPPLIRAAGAEEVAHLRADPTARAAGRRLRQQANTGEVAFKLWLLHKAQASFRAGDPDRDGEADFARDLEELTRAGLVRSLPLRGGVVCGHRIALQRAQDAPGERWVAVASPLRPEDGDRHLLVAEDGVIRSSPEPIVVGEDARPPAGLQPDPRFAGWGR